MIPGVAMGKIKTRADLTVVDRGQKQMFIATANGILDPAETAKALEQYEGYSRADISREAFKDISTNISVRNEFTRDHYSNFRPSEDLPRRQKEIISFCMEAYRKVGIVRNVIDLMGDFGCKGVKLNHPNPRIQEFYRKWFAKVGGPERSERFLNCIPEHQRNFNRI
jgi:hypothetical protein